MWSSSLFVPYFGIATGFCRDCYLLPGQDVFLVIPNERHEEGADLSKGTTIYIVVPLSLEILLFPFV